MRGALTVFSVVIAIDLLGTGPAGAGTLMAAVGVGALVGSVAASFLVGSRRLARWFGVGVALWGAPVALLAVTDRLGPALALLMAVGVGNALVDAGLFTLVARQAPDAVLGRVFGVLESVGAFAVAGGSVLASWATASLGLRPALVVVGALAPLAVLVSWLSLRRLDTTMVVRDADVDRLRAVPMLEPLALPALEHLARGLVAVEVPAGADVVTEGDPGDNFYLVVDGVAEVVGDGRTGVRARAGGRLRRDRAAAERPPHGHGPGPDGAAAAVAVQRPLPHGGDGLTVGRPAGEQPRRRPARPVRLAGTRRGRRYAQRAVTPARCRRGRRPGTAC